jgi:hypothetical protein
MFPISQEYFQGQIKDIPQEKYVHIDAYPPGYGRKHINDPVIPTCYHIAKGSMFKKVLQLPDEWESSLRECGQVKRELQCSKGSWAAKTGWFADEVLAAKRIEAHKDKSDFAFLNREYGHRLQRSDWDHDYSELPYYDAHCLRPYDQHKKTLRNLESAIFKQIHIL